MKGKLERENDTAKEKLMYTIKLKTFGIYYVNEPAMFMDKETLVFVIGEHLMYRLIEQSFSMFKKTKVKYLQSKRELMK